jgi:hypothetical protein
MTLQTIDTAPRLSDLTGAADVFETMLDYVAQRLVAVLGSDEERAREQLSSFRRHFDETYEDIVRRHVGERAMPALIEALDSDAMRRLVRARQAMKGALLERLGVLTRRMGETSI